MGGFGVLRASRLGRFGTELKNLGRRPFLVRTALALGRTPLARNPYFETEYLVQNLLALQISLWRPPGRDRARPPEPGQAVTWRPYPWSASRSPRPCCKPPLASTSLLPPETKTPPRQWPASRLGATQSLCSDHRQRVAD
jgi:hypothetical protein